MTASKPQAASFDGELHPTVVMASMAGVAAAMLMASLDGTIVGTAMPRVIAELHGFEHYTAVTTIYLLASTTVVPIVGKLSDLYGRKLFLLAGVAIFVIGSALCGAATSMPQLVAFRGLQGIGAGFSQAMAFTTIADLFPPARRGRVSGVMGSVFGFSSVIGPAVGGYLTDGPGWRWCFYVNVPVGLAAFLILFFAFPHLVARTGKRPTIDWLGAFSLVLAVVPLLLALSWGGRDYAWSHPIVLTLLTGGLVMSGVFLGVESRAKEAILPPSLFRNTVVWTSAAASAIVFFAMFGSLLFIPLFIQGVIGSSAARSGAVLTPMMFALIGASMLSGQAITRFGKYKAIAIGGVAITGAGLLLLALMDVNSTYGTVLRNMIVVGVGVGLTMPVFPIAAQNAVDISQVGIATSVIQFTRSMGATIGAAIFGALLSNRFGSALSAAISPEMAARVPREMMEMLQNPQALMNPEVAARMRAQGPEALRAIAPMLTALKHALASAIGDVFLWGAIISVLGIVVLLRLVDLPLRTTNRLARPTGEADVEVPVVSLEI
jgi:EmrB/QacA subfamily drug resistance transporter